MITALFWLLCGHALADFSLQTDAMARGKNRHNPITPPANQKVVPCWQYWMTAHALIHAGMVGLVLQSPVIGFVYGVTHWLTDYAKCEGWTNPHTDQAIHVLVLALAVAWWAVI